MRMGLDFEKERGAVGRLLFILMILTALIVGGMIFVNVKIRPFIISVTQGYATNAVGNTMNDIVNEILKEDEYSFANIINDGEGNVCAVTMNSADVNLFMTRIAIEMKEKIADMDEISAEIPLGNFLPHPFFSGLGPSVRVKFLILANSSSDLKESFSDKGINQTLYTLSINSKTKVRIYVPTVNSSVTVENDIPIFRTLIVGKVPDTYTNVEGVEGSAADTVLNIS